nr:hypothetical protein [Pseudoclavibacter helvolus]
MHGERLVELDDVEVVESEAGARQGKYGRGNRCDAEEPRVVAGDGP